MPVTIKNLAYFKSINMEKPPPDFGVKLGEMLDDLTRQLNNIEQQTNANANGAPVSPPAVSGLTVSAQNGHFQVAIKDDNQNLYRGMQYYIEHADNPNFINSQQIHIGDSRNANLFLGNVTRYFRAFSAYAASGPSGRVYHGSQTRPLAVSGGGNVGGPSFLSSQGSGTGAAGVGQTGPGPIPYRTPDGAPPVR